MSLNDLLKIAQFNASRMEVVETGEVLIHGELRDADKHCPVCGCEALKPHQYYRKRVRHLPVFEKPTYLVFERKDWICACGKVFLERLTFQDLKSKYSLPYEEYVYRRCQQMSIQAVAEMEGVSWDIVAGIFKKGSLEERRSARHQWRRTVEAALPG